MIVAAGLVFDSSTQKQRSFLTKNGVFTDANANGFCDSINVVIIDDHRSIVASTPI